MTYPWTPAKASSTVVWILSLGDHLFAMGRPAAGPGVLPLEPENSEDEDELKSGAGGR